MNAFAASDMKAMRRQAGEAAGMLRALVARSAAARAVRIGGWRTERRRSGARSGLSQSALSQHLAKLREEGLVATRRESQVIFYRLDDPRAARLLGILHEIYCKR